MVQQNPVGFLGMYKFLYTVSQKKLGHFYLYDNFGKCGPISIILSLLDW